MATQRKYQEKYATVPITLEKKVESELFPASFGICSRIEKDGEEELRTRLSQFISTKCPLRRCVVLMNEPSKCPIPLCWIGESPSWREFLLPEINTVYSMLMDTYIECLDVSEDPDEEITLREHPLDFMNRKFKTEAAQNCIIEAFKKSEILKPRTSIIKDILWIHNQGKYTLSVLPLIVQIEGILHDLAYHFKWKFERKETYGGESAKVRAILED